MKEEDHPPRFRTRPTPPSWRLPASVPPVVDLLFLIGLLGIFVPFAADVLVIDVEVIPTLVRNPLPLIPKFATGLVGSAASVGQAPDGLPRRERAPGTLAGHVRALRTLPQERPADRLEVLVGQERGRVEWPGLEGRRDDRSFGLGGEEGRGGRRPEIVRIRVRVERAEARDGFRRRRAIRSGTVVDEIFLLLDDDGGSEALHRDDSPNSISQLAPSCGDAHRRPRPGAPTSATTEGGRDHGEHRRGRGEEKESVTPHGITAPDLFHRRCSLLSKRGTME
mmetsp:Transcript_14435/g.42296  ORF Transcript_14435/g.42296 Transcript_14435/m.42296 type:complete len:280 (+) Transcript_14435:1548-2387(+)